MQVTKHGLKLPKEVVESIGDVQKLFGPDLALGSLF